jgi:hypothetical protein
MAALLGLIILLQEERRRNRAALYNRQEPPILRTSSTGDCQRKTPASTGMATTAHRRDDLDSVMEHPNYHFPCYNRRCCVSGREKEGRRGLCH